LGGRSKQVCEFLASLVYRVGSRAARAVIQRNPASKNKSRISGLVFIFKIVKIAFIYI
jgi:ribosomal protein S20